MVCDCDEFQAWVIEDMAVWSLAYEHGFECGPDTPHEFKFCPFCGKKLEVKK
jgi:hypothetical protein